MAFGCAFGVARGAPALLGCGCWGGLGAICGDPVEEEDDEEEDELEEDELDELDEEEEAPPGDVKLSFLEGLGVPAAPPGAALLTLVRMFS